MTPDTVLSSVGFVYKIYLLQLISASVCVNMIGKKVEMKEIY